MPKLSYYQRNKEKVLANSRQYYQKNKKKVLARHRRWLELNKDHQKALCARWAQENKEKVRAIALKHRHRNLKKCRKRDRDAARLGVRFLSNRYIRGLLVNYGRAPKVVPPELIELKRVSVLVKRQLKEMT
jgi:hypothetical protein